MWKHGPEGGGAAREGLSRRAFRFTMPATCEDAARGRCHKVRMEDIPIRLLYLGGAIIVALIVLLLIKRLRGGREEAPEYLEQVRRHVAAGEFEKAAKIQLRQGNKREAFNLLERGEVHDKASKLAEQLGMLERAAHHAEKAAQFERAADLYARSQDYAAAGRLYKRSGLFQPAAEAMERDPSADPVEIARLWERACMGIATEIEAEDQETLVRVQELAEKTALAWRKAGDNQRAATFFDMCQQRQAKTQRGPLSVEALHQKLTQAPSTGPLAQTAGVLELTDLTQSPAQLHGAPVIHREVIYVRDALTEQVTAVSRESDRYKIGEKLGEGGMAVVYEASDTVLDRPVALKFLPEGFTQNAMALRYFEREARAAARLTHPNIVTIYDCGLMSGRPFISMELIQGTSLDKLMERNPMGLPLRDVLQVAEGLFAALEVAHRHKVLHRDIKPANLMWTRDGLIKLMDFGIAGSAEPSKHTVVAGTPYYMAPEQFEGTNLDERTDLFAAGVTLYELMTGELPYEARQQRSTPRRARSLRPAVPVALDDLLWSCIQTDKGQRPASAIAALEVVRAMARELEAELLQEDSVMQLAMSTPLRMAPDTDNLPQVISQLPPDKLQRLSRLTSGLAEGVPLDDESRDMLRSFGIDPEQHDPSVISGDISKALQAYLNSDHEFIARIKPEEAPAAPSQPEPPPPSPPTRQRGPAPVGRVITREVAVPRGTFQGLPDDDDAPIPLLDED
jgi:serine/threonine protein kinase